MSHACPPLPPAAAVAAAAALSSVPSTPRASLASDGGTSAVGPALPRAKPPRLHTATTAVAGASAAPAAATLSVHRPHPQPPRLMHTMQLSASITQQRPHSAAAHSAAAASAAAAAATTQWVPAQPVPPPSRNPFYRQKIRLDYAHPVDARGRPLARDLALDQLRLLEAELVSELTPDVYALIVDDELPTHATPTAATAAPTSAAAKPSKPTSANVTPRAAPNHRMLTAAAAASSAAAVATAAPSSAVAATPSTASSWTEHKVPLTPVSTASSVESKSSKPRPPSHRALARKYNVPIWSRSELLTRLRQVFAAVQSPRVDLDGDTPCTQPRIIVEDIAGQFRPTWKVFPAITPIITPAASSVNKRAGHKTTPVFASAPVHTYPVLDWNAPGDGPPWMCGNAPSVVKSKMSPADAHLKTTYCEVCDESFTGTEAHHFRTSAKHRAIYMDPAFWSGRERLAAMEAKARASEAFWKRYELPHNVTPEQILAVHERILKNPRTEDEIRAEVRARLKQEREAKARAKAERLVAKASAVAAAAAAAASSSSTLSIVPSVAVAAAVPAAASPSASLPPSRFARSPLSGLPLITSPLPLITAPEAPSSHPDDVRMSDFAPAAIVAAAPTPSVAPEPFLSFSVDSIPVPDEAPVAPIASMEVDETPVEDAVTSLSASPVELPTKMSRGKGGESRASKKKEKTPAKKRALITVDMKTAADSTPDGSLTASGVLPIDEPADDAAAEPVVATAASDVDDTSASANASPAKQGRRSELEIDMHLASSCSKATPRTTTKSRQLISSPPAAEEARVSQLAQAATNVASPSPSPPTSAHKKRARPSPTELERLQIDGDFKGLRGVAESASPDKRSSRHASPMQTPASNSSDRSTRAKRAKPSPPPLVPVVPEESESPREVDSPPGPSKLPSSSVDEFAFVGDDDDSVRPSEERSAGRSRKKSKPSGKTKSGTPIVEALASITSKTHVRAHIRTPHPDLAPTVATSANDTKRRLDYDEHKAAISPNAQRPTASTARALTKAPRSVTPARPMSPTSGDEGYAGDPYLRTTDTHRLAPVSAGHYLAQAHNASLFDQYIGKKRQESLSETRAPATASSTWIEPPVSPSLDSAPDDASLASSTAQHPPSESTSSSGRRSVQLIQGPQVEEMRRLRAQHPNDEIEATLLTQPLQQQSASINDAASTDATMADTTAPAPAPVSDPKAALLQSAFRKLERPFDDPSLAQTLSQTDAELMLSPSTSPVKRPKRRSSAGSKSNSNKKDTAAKKRIATVAMDVTAAASAADSAPAASPATASGDVASKTSSETTEEPSADASELAASASENASPTKKRRKVDPLAIDMRDRASWHPSAQRPTRRSMATTTDATQLIAPSTDASQQQPSASIGETLSKGATMADVVALPSDPMIDIVTRPAESIDATPAEDSVTPLPATSVASQEAAHVDAPSAAMSSPATPVRSATKVPRALKDLEDYFVSAKPQQEVTPGSRRSRNPAQPGIVDGIDQTMWQIKTDQKRKSAPVAATSEATEPEPTSKDDVTRTHSQQSATLNGAAEDATMTHTAAPVADWKAALLQSAFHKLEWPLDEPSLAQTDAPPMLSPSTSPVKQPKKRKSANGQSSSSTKKDAGSKKRPSAAIDALPHQSAEDSAAAAACGDANSKPSSETIEEPSATTAAAVDDDTSASASATPAKQKKRRKTAAELLVIDMHDTASWRQPPPRSTARAIVAIARASEPTPSSQPQQQLQQEPQPAVHDGPGLADAAMVDTAAAATVAEPASASNATVINASQGRPPVHTDDAVFDEVAYKEALRVHAIVQLKDSWAKRPKKSDFMRRPLPSSEATAAAVAASQSSTISSTVHDRVLTASEASSPTKKRPQTSNPSSARKTKQAKHDADESVAAGDDFSMVALDGTPAEVTVLSQEADSSLVSQSFASQPVFSQTTASSLADAPPSSLSNLRVQDSPLRLVVPPSSLALLTSPNMSMLVPALFEEVHDPEPLASTDDFAPGIHPSMPSPFIAPLPPSSVLSDAPTALTLSLVTGSPALAALSEPPSRASSFGFSTSDLIPPVDFHSSGH